MSSNDQELVTLTEITQILSDGLELKQVFQRAIALLSDRLHIHRASLVLLDNSTNQLNIFASVGLTAEEQRRGQYAVGEGVTGQVLASGQIAIIQDISKHPDFLDRTGSRTNSTNSDEIISFICLPIKDGNDYVGTMSIDIPYQTEKILEQTTQLLNVIAGMFSQTIRIHHLVQLEKEQWATENKQLRDSLHSKYRFGNIIGSSPAMLDVLATIGQVSSSRATVLLLGETGCGKELIAKAIHYNSPRKDEPLIRVNCGALSPQLLESELYGHIKGAFTGAVRDKIGRFEAANGGTIFLDEIGTLDAQMQVKLLRVLQERELEKVGDHKTIKIDVRVIAATNLDLEEEVRKGNFREDLYYRLNVVTVSLPPLRNRRDDIPKLIDHFLDTYNKENNRNLSRMNRDVLNTLLRYPWPGNVRELENAIERATVLSSSDEFTLELLPLQIRMYAQQTRGESSNESVEALASKLAELGIKQYSIYEGQIYDLVVHEVEKQLIREALGYNDGTKTRTADFLGINRNTLNKKVKDFNITN
ncbi:Nitrogen fixation protein VnfA [Poriferisphaera corsica]|uniref:Nitrogen fixation protein VnfA n=1 Tax=Poriferisphaera corsica TaxID=2528020 RepID=A0A517YZ61_9BACT|nr:sigma 54-interacting transcriptional regulator [Poriferisphaera corsica]QDU35520.1 Nitrogen fixation protein VnfA [Poriferisphaera corsica]